MNFCCGGNTTKYSFCNQVCLAYHNTVVLMAPFSQRRLRTNGDDDEYSCAYHCMLNDQTQVYLFFWWWTNITDIKNLIRTYLAQIGDNYSKMKYKNRFCKLKRGSFFLYRSSSTTIAEFSVSWLEVISFSQFSCSLFINRSRAPRGYLKSDKILSI